MNQTEEDETKVIKVPSNGQITLGRRFAGQTFRMELLSESEILLTRGSFIPDHQATFCSAEAKEQLDKFNLYIKENPVGKDDAEMAINALIDEKSPE